MDKVKQKELEEHLVKIMKKALSDFQIEKTPYVYDLNIILVKSKKGVKSFNVVDANYGVYLKTLICQKRNTFLNEIMWFATEVWGMTSGGIKDTLLDLSTSNEANVLIENAIR